LAELSGTGNAFTKQDIAISYKIVYYIHNIHEVTMSSESYASEGGDNLDPELSFLLPAHGQSARDWLENDPTSEYALWAYFGNTGEGVRDRLEKRLQQAKRAPKIVLATSAAKVGIGAIIGGSSAPYFQDGNIGAGAALVAGGALFAVIGKKDYASQLPRAIEYVDTEQRMYDAAINALDDQQRDS
jgi:hypothetical protein